MIRRTGCFLLFTFFIFGNIAFAQCDVSILRSPGDSACKNTLVQYTAVPSDSVLSAQYSWVVDGDTVSNSSTFSSAQNVATIELVMTALSGCTPDSVFTDTISVNRLIVADYTVISEECNQNLADVQISGISGGLFPYSYELVTVSGENLGQDSNYINIEVDNHSLFITDSAGCRDTTLINMKSFDCPEIVPLELITPNDDGFNDGWHISFIERYPNNEISIFDRWGQRIYHKEGYTNDDPWRGEFIGVDLPIASYFYIIKLIFAESEDIVLKGPVSILR